MAVIRKSAQEQMERKILPFWAKLKDEQYGGFIGYMDEALRTDPKADFAGRPGIDDIFQFLILQRYDGIASVAEETSHATCHGDIVHGELQDIPPSLGDETVCTVLPGLTGHGPTVLPHQRAHGVPQRSLPTPEHRPPN